MSNHKGRRTGNDCSINRLSLGVLVRYVLSYDHAIQRNIQRNMSGRHRDGGGRRPVTTKITFVSPKRQCKYSSNHQKNRTVKSCYKYLDVLGDYDKLQPYVTYVVETASLFETMIFARFFCDQWVLIFAIAIVPMPVQVKKKDMETNSELPVLALVEVKPSQLALGWEFGGNGKKNSAGLWLWLGSRHSRQTHCRFR